MKPRNSNLDWMRKILADLEESRGDPRIAELMAGLTQSSPGIAVEAEPSSWAILGSPADAPATHASRRTKR